MAWPFQGVLFAHAWHPDSLSQGTKVEEQSETRSLKPFLPSAQMECDILIEKLELQRGPSGFIEKV